MRRHSGPIAIEEKLRKKEEAEVHRGQFSSLHLMSTVYTFWTLNFFIWSDDVVRTG